MCCRESVFIKAQNRVRQLSGIKEQIRFRNIAWLMDALDVQSAFSRLGVELTKTSGDIWKGYCPDHHLFTGRRPSHPYWVINIKTGQTFCHTEGRGSNLVYMTARLLECSFQQAAEWLLGNSLDYNKLRFERLKKVLSSKTEIKKKATVANLHKIENDINEGAVYETGLSYFQHPPNKKPTNINLDTLRHYKVFERKWGFYANRVIVPIYLRLKLTGFAAIDILGKDEWIKRHSSAKEKEYRKVLFPSGFKSGENLFGYDDVSVGAKRLLITEGPREVMKLWQEGYKDAVAVFGTNVTKGHLKLLSELAPKNVMIMFDGDEKGREASKKVAQKLFRFFTTYIVEVPNLYDPKTLPSSLLKTVIRGSKLVPSGGELGSRNFFPKRS